MEKKIYFDMDGTIANLYDVPDWLDKLRSYNDEPYRVAEPKVDLVRLANILYRLRFNGWQVSVISWLSKESVKDYDKRVRQAKREWLKKIPFIFDHLHLVKYGTPKHYIGQGLLVDDNAEVRQAWEKLSGITVDAQPNNWLDELEAVTAGI
jgi:hypothetical protein